MTDLQFEKFQGTGNDFIILDGFYDLSAEQIQFLCDRKFGIGADGIIYMKRGGKADFDMMYYNADGSESFCGNGSRCSVMYAKRKGWIQDSCTFSSNDGLYYAEIHGEDVHLKMHDVKQVDTSDAAYVLNTGSPHYIVFEKDIDALDIIEEAHKVRYSALYKEEGINVNYIEDQGDALCIRTYERGVEDETLSCGTGVTAAAIANYLHRKETVEHFSQDVHTKGGNLEVRFSRTEQGFTDIFLCGPAVYVYSGSIKVP